MSYENFKINVYENSNNEGKSETPSRLKYYYTPVALLDHKKAVSIVSSDGKSGELRFSVEMWNEKVEKKVLNYLRGFLGSDMKPHQVQMIPIDEVSLLTSSATRSKTHLVSSEWIPYNQFQKSLNFSMFCLVKNDCDQLAENMRSSPRQFEYLKITMSPTCWNTSLTMGINIVETNEVPVVVPSGGSSLPNASCCNESKTAVDDLKNQLSAALKLFMESKTTVDDLKNQLAETKSQLTERVIGAERTISNLKTELAANSLLLLNSTTNVANLKKELADSNADLRETKQNLATVTSTLAATKADLLSIKDKLPATSANSDFLMQYNISERFKSMYDDYVITKQNLATITSNLTATNADLATTKNDLATTNSKLGNLASTLTSANADLVTNKNDLAATNNNLRAVKTDLAATIADFATTKNNLTAINSNIGTVKSDITGLLTTVNAPPISFYVQRTSSFSTQNVPIPFNVERLNVGGAMNSTTGIFKAPRAGIYFFSFTGIGEIEGYLNTGLYVNGNRIGSATIGILPLKYSVFPTDERPDRPVGSIGPIGSFSPDRFDLSDLSERPPPLPLIGYREIKTNTFAHQSTLQLKANDEISMQIYGGSGVLYDDNRNFNHFTGFLIKTV